MRRLSTRIVSLAALLAAQGAPAGAESLNEAFAAAYATNPTLIAARAGVRATDEGVPRARAGMLPNVSASAQVGHAESSVNGPRSGGSANPRSVSLNAQQVLYDGGQTFNAIDSAVSGVDAARAQLTDTEQTVLLQVVTSYMNVRRDQQFVELAKNNVRVISEQLRAARDRFEVGEVTRTDVALAEARLASAKSGLAAAQGDYLQAVEEFRASGRPRRAAAAAAIAADAG